MIILDTNVLSELLRPQPNLSVTRWIERQPATALFTTTVTQGEMFYGAALIPEGLRKQQISRVVRQIFSEDFERRVLPFDGAAAEIYADVAARRRLVGNPISQFDAMIAAIALSRGASLATRNVKDFGEIGLNLIDPWHASEY